jgi:lysophospholipase L1-like esterase
MSSKKPPLAAIWNVVPALLFVLAVTGCGGGGGGGGVSAAPDSYLIADNQPNTVLNVGAPGVLANDSGGSLTASIVSSTSCGNLNLNADGSFTYTHTATGGPSCDKSDSFTYRASSGGGSATTTVTLNVNQPPAIDSSKVCLETGPETITDPPQSISGTLFASATDPEGQPLTYAVSNGSKGSVSVNALTGEFTYTPFGVSTSRGADTFTFQVSDGMLTTQGTYKIVHTPRVMPLGDSVTWGKNSSNQPPSGERVGYRLPLKTALTNAGYEIDFVGQLNDGAAAGLADEQHEGHGGCRADELLSGIGSGGCSQGQGVPGTTLSDWLALDKPDVVLLHIGTNDLSSAGSFNPNDINDVNNILNVIDTWEGANWPVTVVAAKIITNRELATPETDSFNAALQTMILSRTGDKLEWVDQQANVSVPDDYADLLHPNAGGFQKMSDVWLWPLTGDATISTVSGDHSGPGILPKCP